MKPLEILTRPTLPRAKPAVGAHAPQAGSAGPGQAASGRQGAAAANGGNAAAQNTEAQRNTAAEVHCLSAQDCCKAQIQHLMHKRLSCFAMPRSHKLQLLPSWSRPRSPQLGILLSSSTQAKVSVLQCACNEPSYAVFISHVTYDELYWWSVKSEQYVSISRAKLVLCQIIEQQTAADPTGTSITMLCEPCDTFASQHPLSALSA